MPGISGNVDLDRCYQDFPKVIRGGGFNGYPKRAGAGATAAVPSRKSVEELAREVIAGKWGNGRERQQRLKAAGYDYRVVQRKVNELMG